MAFILKRYLADENHTAHLGRQLAQVVRPGLVIYLKGELGSGKTALARAILRALGYRGKVKSPSFTLLELYAISRLNLYHFDFYRFKGPEEWEDAGFREYFNADSVCLIEWPEKAGSSLPLPDLEVCLKIKETGRNVEINSHTEAGRRCLERLQKTDFS